MTSQYLFQNAFILRRPRVVIFGGIIKIVTIFIQKNYKGSKKVKRIKNYVSKLNPYLYLFFDIAKFAGFR